ncbi:MAG: DUF2442 domain-containing protein [Leptospiraceae bacterium]|nr:DUF2442 domain-containing protein [Leptospiraceae bacterium]
MIPKIVQVFPTENHKVYLYFDDGKIKLYDISHLIDKGVFCKLQDESFFFEKCTVMNNTLAWDVSGTFDPYNCIDLDPAVLYEESIEVEEDPLQKLLSF